MSTPQVTCNGSAVDTSDQYGPATTLDITIYAFVAGLVLSYTALRIASRLILRSIRAEDVLAAFASITTTSLAAVVVDADRHGFGHYLAFLLDAPTANRVENISVNEHLFIAQIMYASSIFFTKASLIITFRRMFPKAKWFQRTMLAVGCLITFTWVPTVFVTIFQCNPVPAAWDITIFPASCVDFLGYSYGSGASDALTSVVLCLAVAPMIFTTIRPLKWHTLLLPIVMWVAAAIVCTSSVSRVVNLNRFAGDAVPFTATVPILWSTYAAVLGLYISDTLGLYPFFTKYYDLTDYRNPDVIPNHDDDANHNSLPSRRSLPGIHRTASFNMTDWSEMPEAHYPEQPLPATTPFQLRRRTTVSSHGSDTLSSLFPDPALQMSPRKEHVRRDRNCTESPLRYQYTPQDLEDEVSPVSEGAHSREPEGRNHE